MSGREDQKSPGVEETAAAWEAPPVLHARPAGPDFDVAKAARETMARFPKIMARLAE